MIDCATAYRCPVAAGAVAVSITVQFTGDESLRAGPMNRGWIRFGTWRECGGWRGGRLPVTVHGGPWRHQLSQQQGFGAGEVCNPDRWSQRRCEVEVIEPAQAAIIARICFGPSGATFTSPTSGRAPQGIRLGAKRTLTATDVIVPRGPLLRLFPARRRSRVPHPQSPHQRDDEPLRTGFSPH